MHSGDRSQVSSCLIQGEGVGLIRKRPILSDGSSLYLDRGICMQRVIHISESSENLISVHFIKFNYIQKNFKLVRKLSLAWDKHGEN